MGGDGQEGGRGLGVGGGGGGGVVRGGWVGDRDGYGGYWVTGIRVYQRSSLWFIIIFVEM